MSTPDYSFKTTAGQTIAREQLLACLNTGTAVSPTWSILGRRVEDSSADYDWSDETSQDIIGETHGSMKKPKISQSFDPYKLDAGDAAITKIWDLAVRQQDAQALCNQDMLIVHTYTGFAERYSSCMVKPTGLGGPGGGDIEMPIEVTYGGTRTVGTATKSGSTITFTPES